MYNFFEMIIYPHKNSVFEFGNILYGYIIIYKYTNEIIQKYNYTRKIEFIQKYNVIQV